MGCCAFALVLTGAPRLAMLFWWFTQPGRFNATFDSFLWPLVGVVFLPWTALMYVFVYPGGISLINWVFLGLALLVDLGAYRGGAKARSKS